MKTCCLSLLVLSAGLPRLTGAPVQVTPFRIEETRVVELGNDKVSRTPAGLRLTLALAGPEAESSVKYGALKLEEAVDDRGTNLIRGKDSLHEPGKFKEYSNAFFRKSKFRQTSQPDAPQIELDLAPSARAATKISRLRGSFVLTDEGKLTTVELSDLSGPGDKKLPVPEAAHLSVTAKVSSKESHSLGIEITGDESALDSLEVVDASGHKISNGMSSWSFNGGPAHKTLGLNKPLDNTMKLVGKVAMDRKLYQVPFDLKDIALP